MNEAPKLTIKSQMYEFPMLPHINKEISKWIIKLVNSYYNDFKTKVKQTNRNCSGLFSFYILHTE